jgi:hypothetical protein
VKNETSAGWANHRFAYISFTICVLEMFVFLCAIALGRTPLNHPILIGKTTAVAWLLGVPASVGFAVAGVFRDSRRGTASMAVIAALVCALFCSLQMLV